MEFENSMTYFLYLLFLFFRQNSKLTKSGKSSKTSLESVSSTNIVNCIDINELKKLLQSGKDAEYFLQTLETSMGSQTPDKATLKNVHNSVLNLPTYIKQNEKVRSLRKIRYRNLFFISL